MQGPSVNGHNLANGYQPSKMTPQPQQQSRQQQQQQQQQHHPPPYRSPPHPQQQPPLGAPYSKFNVSEPNMIGGPSFPGNGSVASPAYRHTLNQESSQNMQHGLRNMMQQSKHQTLDSTGQSMALQQLRNNAPHFQQQPMAKLPLPADTYVSPDNLRDAANRMFARNHTDRASFDATAARANNGGFVGQQQYQQHHHNLQNGAAAAEQPYYSNVRRYQPQPVRDDPRRNSYANQSFRKATGQEKTPPQVPPKPSSRSTSRERIALDQEVDNLDQELKHILRAGGQQRASLGGGGNTPPLPALSPDPESPHDAKKASKPDLLEHRGKEQQQVQQVRASLKRYQDDLASQVTTGALTADLESVLGGLQTDLTLTSGGEGDDGDGDGGDAADAAAIRRQLDGLEGMYSEVLKLLGLRKYGRAPQSGLDRSRRGKMYGSMSSLPSVSSLGSRHLYAKEQKRSHGGGGGGGGRRTGGSKERSNNKRFQRLESHVVTLARSVAHLSSEIRSAQSLAQEVDALRMELQQIRGVGPRFPDGNPGDPSHHHANHHHHRGGGGQRPNPHLSSAHAHRVKKLTKFFGDEPPLLRLFLKDLGYEKYASALEEARIGLLELPCLSEERLERLGVPMGPRMRILQEARAAIMPGTGHMVNTAYNQQQQQQHAGNRDPNNYNVYIL